MKLFFLLGNQLFSEKYLEKYKKDHFFFMAEDYQLCTYEKHHKQKILLFLSCMRSHADRLKKNKFIQWEIKDVLEINDYSKNFDGICMSYGLRNLNNVEEGIKKVFYLLKDKGRAGFLDFNHSTKSSLSNIFQKIYLRFIVVTISRIFNLGPEYAYIEKSIRNFPEKNELINIAKEVGFKKAEYRTILGGQMGILILIK